jgi:hypothetical protein
MNVASMTAIATSQGLPPPGAEALRAGGGVIYFLAPSSCPSPQVRNALLEMR